MTDYEYIDADNGRELEVFRVITLKSSPGVAGIKTTKQWAHVPADRVEEVCAALRRAAGLPPVWTVEKVPHDEAGDETINAANWIDSAPVTSSLSPTGARGYAAQLLAAADEAEARANRPKLPAAKDSVIKVDGRVWVRVGTYWQRTGGTAMLSVDDEMARQDFTVLYDAGAEQ